MTETRQAHLQWCKDRAFEYLDRGDWNSAFTSFFSDLRKHEETRNHTAMELGGMLLVGGHLSSVYEMRKFIDGVN